jgi:xanthine dehydrogenase accessory factor
MSEPVPRLLVVGDGEVAEALRAHAAVLGWPTQVEKTLEGARAALPGSAVVVVTSHHEGVDAPAIQEALAAGAAYVGAMGSRRTQERRRAWLLDHGTPADALSSLHAPIGLDIGADAPAEIAVSILAEVIAVRAGVEGTVAASSLRGRTGPLHPHLAPGTATCPTG